MIIILSFFVFCNSTGLKDFCIWSKIPLVLFRERGLSKFCIIKKTAYITGKFIFCIYFPLFLYKNIYTFPKKYENLECRSVPLSFEHFWQVLRPWSWSKNGGINFIYVLKAHGPMTCIALARDVPDGQILISSATKANVSVMLT